MSKLKLLKGVVENRVKIFETEHTATSEPHVSGGFRKYYKITVGGRTFNASSSLGKRVVSGQEVAFVLDRSEAIMYKDLSSDKVYGAIGSWIVILTSVLCIIFNLFMIPAFMKDNGTHNLSMLLSINAFFIIVLIFSVSYYLKERKAIRLLP